MEEQRKCRDCKKRPAMPAGLRCDLCRGYVRGWHQKAKADALANGLCATCFTGKAEAPLSRCRPCLQVRAEYNARRRSTEAGRILDIVCLVSRQVAAGGFKHPKAKNGWQTVNHSKWLPYQHDQYVARFGPLTEGTVIDHIISRRVLERADGSMDLEGLELIASLPNLRVTTQSDNSRKGSNLDKRLFLHSRHLREQGLDAIDLIVALLDYLIEIGHPHPNDQEMRNRAAYLRLWLPVPKEMTNATR